MEVAQHVRDDNHLLQLRVHGRRRTPQAGPGRAPLPHLRHLSLRLCNRLLGRVPPQNRRPRVHFRDERVPERRVELPRFLHRRHRDCGPDQLAVRRRVRQSLRIPPAPAPAALPRGARVRKHAHLRDAHRLMRPGAGDGVFAAPVPGVRVGRGGLPDLPGVIRRPVLQRGRRLRAARGTDRRYVRGLGLRALVVFRHAEVPADVPMPAARTGRAALRRGPPLERRWARGDDGVPDNGDAGVE
mmetsp:Transcript_48588/g.115669  ORF Transcript_48588/g.115669 Transcript_48588/m.115669 type:complete len:242 (+) Transcript_48588:442-1167(+)